MTQKEFKKAYYLANREKILEKQRQYYERNKQIRREYQLKYYHEHKNKVSEIN